VICSSNTANYVPEQTIIWICEQPTEIILLSKKAGDIGKKEHRK
jgi:hypothetical protein